jgi:hypothetical protein
LPKEAYLMEIPQVSLENGNATALDAALASLT